MTYRSFPQFKKRPEIVFQNHDSGYSLVEVIVVIVVAGIIAAGAGLMINNADRSSKEGKALHRLLADVRYSQETAVAQNTNVNFTVNTGTNRYGATYVATGSFLTSPVSGGDLNVQMNSGEYSGVGISATGLSAALKFNRTGEPSVGGVNLQNDVVIATLNSRRSVMINPAGYTYIQ